MFLSCASHVPRVDFGHQQVQFNDYDSLFGREPLHCGIVKRQAHRVWVHLVGKEYDLLEWDEPPGTVMCKK